MRTATRLLFRGFALALCLAFLSACGGGSGGGAGYVGRLTGDSDSEVSGTLQNQVYRALQRGETDEPIGD